MLRGVILKTWLGKNSVCAPRFVHPEITGISLVGRVYWEGLAGELVVRMIDGIHW